MITKLNKKISKKMIISTLICSFCIILLIPKLTFANGFTDTVCNMISGVICFIADGIVYLCDALGGKFDKLIFNYDGNTFSKDLNLMILKQDSVSKNVLSMYGVIKYIGSGIFIVTSIFITLDFARAADNPQHRAMLIDRLKKFIITLLLLNSIPTLVDVMLAINYVIADCFRLISKLFVSSSMDVSKSFLTDTFKTLYTKATGATQAFVIALIYLVAAVINAWLIIFYMIRDLAIAFLLILAPVLVCLLPFRTDLFVSWLKNMFSNIFTQSIQAFIFTIIIAIVAGLTEKSTLYAQVFALVAFAMFIPMTSEIKRMIGIEGGIGVANSRAGLGAAAMGLMLAGKTVSGLKNKAGTLKENNERINDLKTERNNLNKEHSSAATLHSFNSNMNKGDGLNTKPLNSNNLPRDKNTIQGEINAIRKQSAKSMITGGFATFGATIGAIGASGLGERAAFDGIKMGDELGSLAGARVGNAVNNTVSYASEKGQDIAFGKGIRPDTVSISNGNKNWDLGNIKSNMGNMKDNFMSNMKNIKSDMKFSPLNVLDNEKLAIEKETRQDEMTGLTGDPLRGTEHYKEEKDSIIQTQKLIRQGDFSKASRYRKSTSAPRYDKEAIKNLEDTSIKDGEIDNAAMLYTDANSSILFTQDKESGERKILASYEGNPNLTTPTMETVSFETSGNLPVSDGLRNEFKDKAVNVAVSRFGADSVTNENNEYHNSAQKLIESEVNNYVNQHIERNQSFRQNTGSENIVITGTSVNHENVLAHNSVPNPTSVNIDIPSNITNSHSQDVYSNIESNRVNLVDKANIMELQYVEKQNELMQQRMYTDSLKQGGQSAYNQYNSGLS